MILGFDEGKGLCFAHWGRFWSIIIITRYTPFTSKYILELAQICSMYLLTLDPNLRKAALVSLAFLPRSPMKSRVQRPFTARATSRLWLLEQYLLRFCDLHHRKVPGAGGPHPPLRPTKQTDNV